jgi:hypothetical protein
MIDAWWLFIGIGVFFGFFGGRWYAETFRAMSDRKKVWDGRKGYRG